MGVGFWIGVILFFVGMSLTGFSFYRLIKFNSKISVAYNLLKNFFDLLSISDVAVWVKKSDDLSYLYCNDKLAEFVYPDKSIDEILGKNDAELQLDVPEISPSRVVKKAAGNLEADFEIPPCFYTDILVASSHQARRFLEIMPTGILLDVWKLKDKNRLFGIALKKTSTLEESKKIFERVKSLCFVRVLTDNIIELPRGCETDLDAIFSSVC